MTYDVSKDIQNQSLDQPDFIYTYRFINLLNFVYAYALTIWYWNMNRWSRDSSSHFATTTPFGLSFWEMSRQSPEALFFKKYPERLESFLAGGRTLVQTCVESSLLQILILTLDPGFKSSVE